jgi:nucleotide-binding universal stress UspA family protein
MEPHVAAPTVGGHELKEGLMGATNKPILICYDGSNGARRAIETAGELFPGRKAIVLHAWSPASNIAAAYGCAIVRPIYDDAALEDGASRVAQTGCNLATEAGLDAQPEIAEITDEGTWHTLLDVADQYDVVLVVLGARGVSGFKSLVLGSVSYGVAQHAHLPVLVVPPALSEENTSESVEHTAATAAARRLMFDPGSASVGNVPADRGASAATAS